MSEPGGGGMGAGRIRARPAGLVSPVTKLPIFRIEDSSGQVLRRIGSARDAGEAIAHYWRTAVADARVVSAMSDELPADAALRRRIELARGARSRRGPDREAMLTHELPLSGPAPDGPTSDGPDSGSAEAVSPPRQAAARRRPPAKPVEQDLFAIPGEAAPEGFEKEDARRDDAEPAIDGVASEPEPVPEAPHEKGAGPKPAPRTAYHLDPHAVPTQPVDHRNLRPTDRPDSYLYHIGSRTEADAALRNGLAVSAQDPIILTERPGVAYWLSVLAEDYDVILDGPVEFVVLRIRRFAVEELLEADPDASRSAGCACYLLTGGPGQG